MKVPIKATSDGVAYASKSPYDYEGKQYEADLQDKDVVQIVDEGSWEEGQWGDRLMLKIETRNGTKKASVNQTSINILAEAWGDDTVAWKGKEVTVLLKKTMIAGEKRLVAYFVTAGYYVDDFGDVVKDEAPQPRGTAGEDPVTSNTSSSSDEIKPEDIPF